MTAPDRPSRQSLVVPPRANPSVALGAAICGCIGFAMVWAIGLGRTVDRRPLDPPPAAEDAALATGDQWQPRTRGTGQASDAPADRAAPDHEPVADPAVAPASFRSAAAPPEPVGRPLSRFSAGPRRPDAEPTAAPGRLVLPPDEELAPAVAAATSDAAPVTVEAPLGDPEPLETSTALEHAAVPEAAPAANGFADAAAAPVPAPVHDDAGPAPALLTAPSSTVAGPPPSVPPATAAATAPMAPPDAFGPAQAAPMPPPVPTAPAARRPAAATVPAAAQAVPFASAPELVPEGVASPSARVQPPADVAGQGRPGPIQLEGVQSPQLTVEKRGPREVQVGKPARYEILVRNVGAAVAHDVTLRDTVPFGAALVTTTPPAVPGRAAPGVPSDELVWNLGALTPGGQARVTVEIMPQAEGEIGSVASVTFRADASTRSRATKPALALACTDPQPVLIGRDAALAITISNPGSGVATGVVLEGLLPDNVSHRSGRELEFDVGQLKPGESKTIELVLGTRGSGVHTARLAARADGGIEVQQAVRLEVTAPALEIGVDMPLRRFLQRPATCAISMANAGTAPARSVELAAQLPPGMKFVRANNAGWHDERTHRVLWNLEELPPGETGTVEVVVMPVELGPQKIMAAARSADGLAHQAAHVCDVEGLAALVFEVADSEDPIEVEGVTEYVVRVGNQGTKAATGVRLAATLLGDLEPVAAQGPAGHRVENLVVSFEPLAKLAPAEEAVYRIRAKGRSAGDQRVQVQITSEDHPAPITKEETTRVYADR